MSKPALIIVDAQNDFCEGGSLPVTGGNAVCERIAQLLEHKSDEYGLIVASQDWHEDPGDHWASETRSVNHKEVWPVHCPAGGKGALLHPAIAAVHHRIDFIVRKGMHAASYSAFDPQVWIGRVMVNPEDLDTKLSQWSEVGDPAGNLDSLLLSHGIEEVHIVGLAFDHCVAATARDAKQHGYKTAVLTNFTAAVGDVLITKDNLEAEGIICGPMYLLLGAETAAERVKQAAFAPKPDYAGLQNRVEQLISEFEFRPDYRIVAARDAEDPDGRVYMQAQKWRQDTYTKEWDWGHGGKAYLSTHAATSELLRTMLGLLLRYDEHEVREDFKWRGRRIFGPHISAEALWEAAPNLDVRP